VRLSRGLSTSARRDVLCRSVTHTHTHTHAQTHTDAVLIDSQGHGLGLNTRTLLEELTEYSTDTSCVYKNGKISSYYVTIRQLTVFVNSALICNIQSSSRIVKFSLFFF